MKSGKKTLTEQRQEIIDRYRAEHGNSPATMSEIARWAYRNGHIGKLKTDIIKMIARELSRAAREQYTVDPQGRTVRQKHAASRMEIDGEYRTLWDDIETATPEHMRLSLNQRRHAIVGDNRQLKSDTDSYNDNNPHGAYIDMSYDYRPDMAEMEQPTEYPDAPPPDADLDDPDEEEDA